MAVAMKKTLYDNYWYAVLSTVIEAPMTRAYDLAETIQMDKYKFTYVLTTLVKRGFVQSYEFEVRDVYLKKRKYYYATTKGQLLYLQTAINAL
jgi:DNA-binding PadR family transcriptional regulator